jgi:cell division protein FtsW (lipid II flippase)
MLLEILLVVLLFGFSLIMLIASSISYIRVRNPRLLIVSVAFLVFLIQGILLLIAVFTEDLWKDWGIPWHYLLLQLIAIVMFYFAVAKK